MSMVDMHLWLEEKLKFNHAPICFALVYTQTDAVLCFVFALCHRFLNYPLDGINKTNLPIK